MTELFPYPDVPIKSKANDKFGRSRLADGIARQLRGWQGSTSLVAGIMGPWGSGKTSFLEMVREAMQETVKGQGRAYIVEFNPWMFTAQHALLRRFFDELSAAMGKQLKDKKYKGLTRRLEAVGIGLESVSPLVPGGLLGLAGKGLRATEKARQELRGNLEAAKNELEAILKDVDGVLVIALDDIDRLSNEEIRLVFQLVKLTANFPRTVYVMAFDPQAVADALQLDFGERFIEKVVQLPVHLPAPSKAALRDFLFEKLGEVVVRNGIDWQGGIPGDFGVRLNDLYRSWAESRLRVPRDAIRLANGLGVTLPLVSGDVDLADFLAVEMIRVWEPEVYDRIASHRWELTDPMTSIGSARTQMISRLFPQNPELHPLLNSLFNRPLMVQQIEAEKHIISPNFVHRYFEWNLDAERDVPQSEFIRLVGALSDTKDLGPILETARPRKIKRLFEELELRYTDVPTDQSKSKAAALTILKCGYLAPEEHITTAFTGMGANIQMIRVAGVFMQRLTEEQQVEVLKMAAEDARSLGTLSRYVRILKSALTRTERLVVGQIQENKLDDVIEHVVAKIEEASEKREFWRIREPNEAVYLWAELKGWEPIQSLVQEFLAENDQGEMPTALEILSRRSYSATDRVTENIGPDAETIEALGGIEQYKPALDRMRTEQREIFKPWQIGLIDELIDYQSASSEEGQ